MGQEQNHWVLLCPILPCFKKTQVFTNPSNRGENIMNFVYDLSLVVLFSTSAYKNNSIELVHREKTFIALIALANYVLF